MQLRGRHRGLPYELDRAVLLPSEKLQAKEAGEGQRMLQRRRLSLGGMPQVDGQVDGSNVRADTGLCSGYELEGKTENESLEAKLAERHRSDARQILA